MSGHATANSIVVAAGTNGDIAIYTTDETDLVLDIDGYYVQAPAGIAGPQGAQGPQGPASPAGANGLPGATSAQGVAGCTLSGTSACTASSLSVSIVATDLIDYMVTNAQLNEITRVISICQ